jgi:Tfp pilus assembly protein PilN
MHAAMRLLSIPPPDGFLAMETNDDGSVEIYGESPARPVFSAEFDVPGEKAVAHALAELRLPQDVAAVPMANILPAPRTNPADNDLSRNALPYATALAGACPRLAPSANLLPPQHRTSNSRAVFVPTLALAAVLLLLAGTLVAFSKVENRLYLQKLEREIAALEPQVRKSAALDREIDLARSRSKLLDEFRQRTRDDLDALNELSRLVPPPAWTNSIELTRDSANISGEAEQAAALLSIIDASPLFQNSEFASITKLTGANDMFRIHAAREFRK